MRAFIGLTLLFFATGVMATDIFLIQPPELVQIEKSQDDSAQTDDSSDSSWLHRVRFMLADAGLGAVSIIGSESAGQSLMESSQWPNLTLTNHASHQVPVLAQQLKTTEINTLVIADTAALIELAASLGSEATTTTLGNHGLVHLLRIHQRKLVDTILLTAGE